MNQLLADRFTTALHEFKQVSGDRYDVSDPKLLGEGSYSIVFRVYDIFAGKHVAVKKIFRDILSRPHLAVRILRELQALMHFRTADNIIGMVDLINPTNNEHFDHIFVVTELMDFELARICKPVAFKGSFKMDHSHFQFFTYQMLLGLAQMHTANAVHRDLKPANILVNKDCRLKICDLGLVRNVNMNDQSELTEYVVTRWYRAPEIIIGFRYGTSCDMWSVGCILAEIILKRPLIEVPSRKDFGVQAQLMKIFDVLGVPDQAVIDSVEHENVRAFLNHCASTRKRFPSPEFRAMFDIQTEADMHAYDLICRLLQFRPTDRLTACQALQHPYIQPYTRPDIVESIVKGVAEFKNRYNPNPSSLAEIKLAMAALIRDYNGETKHGIMSDDDLCLETAEQAAIQAPNSQEHNNNTSPQQEQIVIHQQPPQQQEYQQPAQGAGVGAGDADDDMEEDVIIQDSDVMVEHWDDDE